MVKNMTYKQKRIIKDKIFTIACTLTFIISIAFLFWILFILAYKGYSALHWSIFINDGAPPMSPLGGIRHAIVGQLILVLASVVVGVPIGMLAGTYISEYKSDTKIGNFIKTCSDISLSVPSIIIGTFVYVVVVIPSGHFSGWAGVVALSIMLIPIVLRTTNEILALVPQTLREAAYALGASRSKTIISVVYKEVKTGLITGILLSVARIAGETAPLLFTSFNDNYLNFNLNNPMPSLTVTMYNYATSPYSHWQSLGWAAAFILTAFILVINIFSRIKIKKGK